MNRIKELREEKGESLVEASKNSGIPYQTFRNYEIGKRKPNGENAVKLADYFGVSVAYIVGTGTSGNKNRLKKLRKEKGVSLDDLSKATGIPKTSLSEYETGPRAPRTTKTWDILADYFGVSTAYIMGLNTVQNENEITITRNEYERLKAIEQKYNEIKSLVSD